MAIAAKHIDCAGGRAHLVRVRGRNAVKHRALRALGAAAARKVDARDGLALRFEVRVWAGGRVRRRG